MHKTYKEAPYNFLSESLPRNVEKPRHHTKKIGKFNHINMKTVCTAKNHLN